MSSLSSCLQCASACAPAKVQQRAKWMTVLIAVIGTTFLLTDWLYLPSGITASRPSAPFTNRSHHHHLAALPPSCSKTPAGVPKLLHFVYRDTNMLEAYRHNIAKCIELNANWTVVLWTDASVKLFLAREFPSLQSVFYQFKYKIQRADAIRYVVLLRFGGVYMDLDMLCHQPLLTSLSDIPCFLDKGRTHQTEPHSKASYVMNSAMGCTPRHPFFKLVVNTVLHPEMLANRSPFPSDIFQTTGPAILTRLHEKWTESNSKPPVTVLKENYFSPRMDPGTHSECRRIVSALGKRRQMLSTKELSCLDLERHGYEKSDDAYITNLTVAIHQYSHLGYRDQNSKTFDLVKTFRRVRIYDGANGTEGSTLCLP